MLTQKSVSSRAFILITGASMGIGYEMAKLLAEKRYNLVLVARSQSKLEEIQIQFQERYGIEVVILFYDLTEPNSAKDLYSQIQSMNLTVIGLVNNAGFGVYGEFIATSLDRDEQMIALNVTTLVGLTKLFAADMVKRGEGSIMNIASLLSFLPFPYYSVYSATKAFVLAFTETVAAELEGTGVRLTALCPGTVETAFHSEAMRKTNAMSANKPIPAAIVAKQGIALLLSGKGKKIVGNLNWFLSNLPRITPDSIMMKIKKKLASEKH